MKKGIIYLIIILLILVAGVLFLTSFISSKPKEKPVHINTNIDPKIIELKLSNSIKSEIVIDSTTEESKKKGLKSVSGSFSIINHTDTKQNYKVYIEDITESNVKKFRYSDLECQIIKYDKSSRTTYYSELKDVENMKNTKVIDEEGIVLPKKTNKYSFKIWVMDSARENAIDRVFKSIIKISQ